MNCRFLRYLIKIALFYKLILILLLFLIQSYLNRYSINYYYPNYNVNIEANASNIISHKSNNFTINYLNNMSEDGKHFISMNLDFYGQITDLEYFVNPNIRFIYSEEFDGHNKLIKIISYRKYFSYEARFYLYARFI